MKNKYLLLLKMQFFNFLGINRLRYSSNKREIRRSFVIGFSWLLVIGLLITYSAIISIGFVKAGAIDILPIVSTLICSIITLVLTFLKSTGVLFGLRDYDMIMSLPVKKSDIVLSRLTMIYFTNLLISAIVVLPTIVIFGGSAEVGIYGSIMLLFFMPFLPIIPMIISLALGVLITALSCRSKHKNIYSLALSTLAVLLVVIASTQVQNMGTDELLNIGFVISNVADKLYPPATLISKAVESQNWLLFSMFAGMSILVSVIFTVVVSYFYQSLNTITSNYATTRYEDKPLKVSSPFKAMYKREFHRYFSCTIYALNSTIGIILLFVASVLLLFISPQILEKQIGIIGLNQILRGVLPFVIAIFITMTSTASASLSLEGKSRWIMCSIPVRAIDIFNAKIAVNLTVIFPFMLISTVLLGITMKVSLIQAVFLCIVPTVYALFISVFGMYMNVKFPKYDWTSEYYAIKGGSISVLSSMGVGMLSSLIPLFICIIFSDYTICIMSIVSVFLLIVSFVLYKKLHQYRLYEV
ncbi:Uncharacterised protein [Clostridioides difficile]|uniref:hypothetical protein n=1 Tax=Clostridioides difficile TaxID=1496 RepID=UPI000980107E|nr:hypothetical protein [Clostridioides difficile]SJS96375.1 Uncharacterised protein [Clostridioides difficile]HBG4987947.1 hypothetical protein [Clostridioides difficile]HBZ0210389.1 hypothetical protein [Clostridioides difficile]